ncbi:MAG TPA: UDP-3-O-(3-hydroxymyristoyl)glucosamine N-acyltransferase [Steroidobacteraceae bacterium]|nr:UDP-3-O-(3-hydroxymyristoyl)glucosamine N-acyltransferase [Steroidobacteraceae bacterium]
MTVTLGELAVRFGCELRGDPAVTVDSVAALSQAGPRSITFLANSKYVAQLAGTRAGAVILDAKSAGDSPVPALVVANPHATYARVATLLHPDPPLHPGVHPTAIAAGATIDPTAEIAAHAYIGEGARIGARCFIGPGSVIERGADIGHDSRFIARVFVGHDVMFGKRCIVQPGAVIGGDGFGFAPEKGTWIKVPQIGGVKVGDDVEIGANTTIDRGALDDTIIEEGVKLDNLIMIAHNVRIGAHSALAAAVAIAGSSVVGKRCVLAGKVGLSGHVTLCDDVVVLGTSFISHSITRPGVYSSALPSEEAGVWRRIVGRIKRLDSMARRLRAVEKHVGFSAIDKDSSED